MIVLAILRNRSEFFKIRNRIKKYQFSGLIISIVRGVSHKIAQSPYRSPEGIFGAHFIKKIPVKTKEVSESTVLILHVMNVAQVNRHKFQGFRIFLLFIGH